MGILERSEDASPLTPEECVWRDRYSSLESRGYRLRQRYKADWKPTWLTTNRPMAFHDDFKINDSAVTIDAVRVSDGRRVYLKRVPVSNSELTIYRFLSDKERLQDPKNHTAPLLDEFLDDEDPSIAYIVMPLLRPYDFPEFYSVDEVIDFVKQILEGIVYMHGLYIAHRDCSHLNIMMNADPLYPRGLHPLNMLTDNTGYKIAHPKRRRDVPSVRYYFIDFGISTMFTADSEHKRVLGIDGQDEQVPELSNSMPYDPYMVDVFILGNLIKKAFYEKYENLGFLDRLIFEMTQKSPRARCTSVEALELFDETVSLQPGYALRWRLKVKSLGRVARLLQDFDSISHEVMFRTKRVISSSSEATTQWLRRTLGSNRPS